MVDMDAYVEDVPYRETDSDLSVCQQHNEGFRFNEPRRFSWRSTSMDSQIGTGGEVQLQREAYRPTSFAYESVSGERWAEGIETAGSRSTGESGRRSIGALLRKHLLPQRRIPMRVIQQRRLCLQLCIDELERARENSDDPIFRATALPRSRTTSKRFGTCWKAIFAVRSL